MQYKISILSVVLFGLQACFAQNNTDAAIRLDYMDTSVQPGDDFYRYVNGNWLKETKIPDDRTRWGSFDELIKSTNETVSEILDGLGTNKNPTADEQKVNALKETFIDWNKRNALGIKPIKPFLDKIEGIKNMADVQTILEDNEKISSSALFGTSIRSKFSNSDLNVLYMGTGATGLPEREYYISNAPEEIDIREKYKAYITAILTEAGKSPKKATEWANIILDYETKLETAKMEKEKRRDSRNLDHFVSVEELSKMVPLFQWDKYLKNIGIVTDSLNVNEPEYMKAVNKLLTTEPIENTKAYIYWTMLNNNVDHLTQKMDELAFDFYGKTLRGQKQQRAMEERTVQLINGTLGEVLGKLYVAKAFPPEAKQVAEAMVAEVIKATGERIRGLSWMSDETKNQALYKLSKINVKIGYPDKWKDYSKLQLKSYSQGGNFLENMMAITKWNYDYRAAQLNKPVDKSEWYMSPQTVNAYYNSRFNEIVFPAAIMQPPFFNFKADAAVNFGGMGAVIGHEISHGFDDSGSRYDADGNLKSWWTEQDREKFDTLGKRLVAEYDGFEPLPGLHVNGEFTLGENIGDLGGVNIAYQAFQNYQAIEPQKAIDGFTPNQRFFLSWATIWRNKIRDEALRERIKTDPHSPGEYRAIGPIINVDAFYEAFKVESNNKLYKPEAERIIIW